MAWFTADPLKPYLVKASCTEENGYSILITDMETTYFCAADQETIKNEKKTYNPTIKTDDFKHLVNLLHSAISRFDPNALYTFEKVTLTLVKFGF